MNELMLMIGLMWSSPVAFENTTAPPVKPAQTVAAKPKAVLARADLTVVKRDGAVVKATTTAAAPRPAVRRHAILFFTASWCPACLRMKSETLPYISLPGHELRVIDFDQNAGLGRSYGIASLPAYVVLDGMGRAYKQGVGFRDVQQFVNFLNGR